MSSSLRGIAVVIGLITLTACQRTENKYYEVPRAAWKMECPAKGPISQEMHFIANEMAGYRFSHIINSEGNHLATAVIQLPSSKVNLIFVGAEATIAIHNDRKVFDESEPPPAEALQAVQRLTLPLEAIGCSGMTQQNLP